MDKNVMIFLFLIGIVIILFLLIQRNYILNENKEGTLGVEELKGAERQADEWRKAKILKHVRNKKDIVDYLNRKYFVVLLLVKASISISFIGIAIVVVIGFKSVTDEKHWPNRIFWQYYIFPIIAGLLMRPYIQHLLFK